jgi:LAO/AO transport system kinase
LGGVARKTREAMLLCEAAGYSIIFIETVGVGQSETTVQHLTDMFLLLLVTGAGDELQGIKRGIMEMADLIIINKADGLNKKNATQYRSLVANSVHLFSETDSGWIPKTLTCSATEGTGIVELWKEIETYFSTLQVSGFLTQKRLEQSLFWQKKMFETQLLNDFYKSKIYSEFTKDKQVNESLYPAIKKIISSYYSSLIP